MKTKWYYFLIGLSTWNISLSQEYHPFLEHSSWIIGYSTPCCVGPYSKTIPEGVAVPIGNYIYTRFLDPTHHMNPNLTAVDTVYVREDVAARKVYKYADGAETLLYDFALFEDDSVQWGGATWTVTLVDEVAVADGTRKRITLKRPVSATDPRLFTQKWIEGVGSNKPPFEPDIDIDGPVFAPGGYPSHYTTCSFQDGMHVYGNSDCPSVLDLSQAELSDLDIVFYPNPFSNDLVISSGNVFLNATFKLYNAQGQLVREFQNLEGKKITVNRGNLGSGLYFARLYDQDKLIKTSKVLVN